MLMLNVNVLFAKQKGLMQLLAVKIFPFLTLNIYAARPERKIPLPEEIIYIYEVFQEVLSSN